MQTIKVPVGSLRLVDNEAAAAYNRLATLLKVPNQTEEAATVFNDDEQRVEAVSNVALLVQKIFALERENAILRFMAQKPGFDPAVAFATLQDTLEKNMASGKVAAFELCRTYNYEFFKLMSHPDYVFQVCSYLVDICTRQNIPTAGIWQDLIATCGLVSDDLIELYESKLDEKEDSKF